MNIIMKVGFLALTMFISTLSFADGKTVTRSNCNGGGWKYKARSRVTKGGVPTTDKETKCYQVPYYDYPNTWASNNCAYQSATNQWGAESQYGAVTKWYWLCARGNIGSNLYYSLVDNKLKEQPKGYEYSRVSCNDTKFENDRVIKEGINASFTVLGKDLFSSLEIIMWLPNEDYDDSIPTKEKTFWKGKIELVNGIVKLSGDFPKDSYSLTQRKTTDGVEYHLEITNLNIEAKYPRGINKTNLIEVVMISDAGVNENKAIQNAIKESLDDNVFDVTVYPNPTSDKLQIELDLDNNNNQFKVELFDANGSFIKEIYKSNNLKRSDIIIIELNELNLKSGLYYILISDMEKSQLCKIVYTN